MSPKSKKKVNGEHRTSRRRRRNRRTERYQGDHHAGSFEPEEQLLRELPELPSVDQDPLIYTQQTDLFKPERVVEILQQVTIGNDLYRWQMTRVETIH